MSYTNIRTAQGDMSIDLSYTTTSQETRDFDPEYDKMSMWDQLGKILDSQDNPLPRDDVTTDAGEKIKGITPRDCIDIRKLSLQLEKTEHRLDFFKRIQKSAENFKEVLNYVRTNR